MSVDEKDIENFSDISTLMLRKSEQQLYCNHVVYNDHKWRQSLIPQREATFYSRGEEHLPWDYFTKCQVYERRPQQLPSIVKNETKWDKVPPPVKDCHNPCNNYSTMSYPVFDALTRGKNIVNVPKYKLEDMCGDCGKTRSSMYAIT